MFGKLANKDGFNKVVSDLDEVILKLKSDFPGKKVILLSHSFGSFVAQSYMEKFGEKINASVLCGSTGPGTKRLSSGKFIIGLVKLFRGGNYKSKTIDKLFFKDCLKKIPNPQFSKEWVCKNPDTLMMYQNDSWCGGIPTLSFFSDVIYGLKNIHKTSNMKKIPQELPIFMIAGTEDPIGNYGESLKLLKNIYNQNGIKTVDLKLYDDCRHELFNEKNSDEVINDVVTWIQTNVK